MDVLGLPVPSRDVAAVLEDDLGRAGEVRRAADHLGQLHRDGVEDLGRSGTRRLRVLRRERGQVGVPGVGEPAVEASLELGGELGVGPTVGLVLPLPLGLEPGAALSRPAPVGQRLLGDMEWLEARPAQALLRQLHFFLAERRAVRLGGVLLVRAAVRDVRPHDDERRPVGGPPGR